LQGNEQEESMSHSPACRPMRPRSLVTGGAGFLGSHVCDRLLAEGHEVICVDNLLTGSLENIRACIATSRFTFIHHDVTEPIKTKMLSSTGQNTEDSGNNNARLLDYILHFASPASPKDYARHPIETLTAGALGTLHALNLAKATGSVFFLASSSEVYGDPELHPQPEGYWGRVNPIGPRSVYDESKRFAEALTFSFHREYGVEIRVARFFNTYGERMRIDDGRALPTFMAQALQEKPVTVYGDGSQTRSLCYVGDLVEGIYRLLLSQEVGPVNLGNPEEITVLDLAKEIIALTGSRSRIVFDALPVDDPRCRRPDIAKAQEALDWRPQICRREGVKLVIPYFKSKLDGAAVADVGDTARLTKSVQN
jgi:dTDP-glucose 4,6-dehydratase